jgi:hypothetical protein
MGLRDDNKAQQHHGRDGNVLAHMVRKRGLEEAIIEAHRSKRPCGASEGKALTDETKFKTRFHSLSESSQSAQCCIISLRCGRYSAWL